MSFGCSSKCAGLRSALSVHAIPAAIALVLFSFGAPQARSGELDDFEAGKEKSGATPPPARNEGTKPDKPAPPKPNAPAEKPQKVAHRPSESNGELVGIFMAPYGMAITAGGIALIASSGLNSMGRVYSELACELEPRRPGEALIPFFEFDASYQRARGDVTAWDYRGEAGLGFLAFQARQTFYDERAPADDLRLTQLHGLYRMSFGDSMEIDIGAGSLTVKGNEKNTGFSATMPVKFYPNDIVGLEWRPVWSTVRDNRISDNDVAMTFGWRYASVRLGYRWVYSRAESLNGPQVGLSLRW